MNRTNSVEPTFSQPLQLNYHQLLQNKTKVEDELYQTQRQLRRKDGEYQKKIAVYEQKIEQLEQCLDEFKEREASTKLMQEKILQAMNTEDEQSYQIDIERVQELLQQICRTTHSSHPQPISASHHKSASSFDRDQQKEALEHSLKQSAEQLSKLKQLHLQKEKELSSLKFEFAEFKEQASKSQQALSKEFQTYKAEAESLQKHHLQKEQTLQQKCNADVETMKLAHKEEKAALENKIKELEQIIATKGAKDQVIALDMSFQQENQEIKQMIERIKQDREQENEKWEKDREQLQQQVQQAEITVVKVKKQMNSNLANNNEATKRLKQKLQEAEKEMQAKTEEIARSKIKVQTLKAQLNKFEIAEKKQANTAGLFSYKENCIGAGKVSMPFKESVTPVGDTSIMGDLSQLQRSSNKISNIKIPNRNSQTKMLGRTQTSTSQLATSRNFNCPAQTGDISQQQQLQASLIEDKNSTPNSISKGKLNHQIQQYLGVKKVQNKSKGQKNYNEASTASLTSRLSSNKDLLRYVEDTDQADKSEQQAFSKESLSQKDNESDKVLCSSLEIECIVRRMLEQVKTEQHQCQAPNDNHVNKSQILSPSSQQNSLVASQNITLSRKQKDNSHQKGHQCSNQKNGSTFLIDKDFLLKLENALKQVAQSNERIKQVVREKENFEKQYLRTKKKVSMLKEERAILQQDRDGLIVQNQKIECKLKQAQVILNLDGENGNSDTSRLEMSHTRAQKSKISTGFTRKDHSPIGIAKLNLNVLGDGIPNQRYKNPPMSCRANESYEKSLRLNHEMWHNPSQKKLGLHNTLEKGMLDHSLMTIKRENNANQPNSITKFLPSSSTSTLQMGGHPQFSRGTTPTLHINLASNNNAGWDRSPEPQVDSSVSSVSASKNFSKSTTNLFSYKNFPHQYQTNKQGQKQQQKHATRYSSNKDQHLQLFRSPQTSRGVNNQAAINNSLVAEFNMRERSPQNVPLSTTNKTILKRINSTRCKDRYYSRRPCEIQDPTCALEDEEDYEHIANQCDGTINIQFPKPNNANDQLSFDDEEVEQSESHETNQHQRQLHFHGMTFDKGDQGGCIKPSELNEEGSAQLKLVNYSSFAPSYHSRYVTKDPTN